MLLSLRFAAMAGLIVSCHQRMPHSPVTLPDGHHAIRLDCDAPSMVEDEGGRRLCACEEEANSLCPFGFNIIRMEGYTSFDPRPGPEIWDKSTRKIHHEVLTISCLPIPTTLEKL